MEQKKKVVVAFSGGLDTSFTVMYLANEIEAGVCAPARFHPKENCIFLALRCSYPFAAPA